MARESEAVAYATPMLPKDAHDPLASVMTELKETKWKMGQRRPTKSKLAKPRVPSSTMRLNSLEMRIRQLELENQQLRLSRHNCEVCGHEIECKFCVEKRKKPLPIPRESTISMEVVEVRTERKPLPIPEEWRMAHATMEVVTVERAMKKPLPMPEEVRQSNESTEEIKRVSEGVRESVYFFDSTIRDSDDE